MWKYLVISAMLRGSALAQGLTAPLLPYPADGATEVDFPLLLTWTQAAPVDSTSVYFGTVPDPPVRISGPQVRSFQPLDVLPTFFPLATYYWRVEVRRGTETVSSPVWSFTTAAIGAAGLRFVPVTPCRLVDTREDRGNFGKPHLSAGVTRTFELSSYQTGCGVSTSALAYSLNITVVPKGPLGYLTIWPGGVKQPLVSTLNSFDGRVKANAAIVPAGFATWVSVYATNDTELIIDINGYFSPAGVLSFYPLPPCRLVDTRNPNGALGGPILVAGATREFPVLSSNCGVPATAQAYALNATVVPQGPLGYLTLWPSGQAQPLVSTLNAPAGNVVANAAIVPAGSGGSISAFVTGPSHLVFDINGYFAPAGAANAQRYFPVTPCRLVDTRLPTGEFGGPVQERGLARAYRVPLTNCQLPDRAAAFSLNATVVPAAGGLGYLTMWPTGSAQPLVSTLNAVGDPVVSNALIVPAGTAGGVSSFVTDRTHLVLDTNGYFAPPCGFAISATNFSLPAVGSGLVQKVTVNPNGGRCGWTARSNVEWVSITSGQAGVDDGVVTIQAEANRLPFTRAGSLRIAELTVQVSQAAADCSYAITPPSASFSAAGGSGTFQVSTSCDWFANGQEDWVSVSQLTTVSGSGQATYSVEPNPGAARSSLIFISNRSVTVNQAGKP